MPKAKPTSGKPKILYRGKHLNMVARKNWEYAHRPNITGIVGVVAVTNGKLILIEQYRAPLDAYVIELPAGLVGDAGDKTESLATAAGRELLEETGYAAKTLTPVGDGTASAGLTDEVITLFRATGLKKVGDGGGDDSEDITVHEVPLNTASRWLTRQRQSGKHIDLKVYAGLYFAGRK